MHMAMPHARTNVRCCCIGCRLLLELPVRSVCKTWLPQPMLLTERKSESSLVACSCAVSSPAALAGVFVVTDFFAAGLNADKETQWGTNAVDAAKEVQKSDLMLKPILAWMPGCLCRPCAPALHPIQAITAILTGLEQFVPEECCNHKRLFLWCAPGRCRPHRV